MFKILTLFYLILSMNVMAYDKKEVLKKYIKVQKKVEKMVKKGWTFYAYENSQIYLLNGKYRYTKVSFEEFYMPRLFQRYAKEYKPQQVGLDVIYFYTNNFNIILRRNGKFFKMKDGLITKFNPFSEPRFNINIEQVESYKKAQCRFCSFKLSFNQVSVDQITQYNAEVAWLPYYSLTDYTGLRFSIGFSPYTVENDDLEEVVDLGVKAQVLFRQYIYNVFLEAGGGTLYFTDSAQFSPMATVGVGYTFLNHHWFLSEKFTLSGLFFHISTINWDKPINEAKFGFGLSF